MKRILLILAVTVLPLTSLAGDILTLKNEMVFEGKVTKIKDCSVVFKAGGKKHIIPASEIFSVQFENTRDRVFTEYMALADEDPDKCLKGRLDAKDYHGRKGLYVLLGLFGPGAIIVTALGNPTPETGESTKLMSKNAELFCDPVYLHCYRKKATGQLIKMEALGFAAVMVLVVTAAYNQN